MLDRSAGTGNGGWGKAVLATRDRVAERIAISMAGMAVLSALATIRFSGFWPSCTSNILFYRGSARFSDLMVVVSTTGHSNPYSQGFEYPPGSLPVIRLLSSIWFEAPQQTGIAWLYNLVGRAVPQDLIQACQPEPLLWAHLAVVGFGLVSVSLLIYALFSSGYSRVTRWTASAVGGFLFVMVIVTIEVYSIVLLVTGGLVLLGVWLGRRSDQVPVLVLLVPLIATAYPIVFGVDRGNLDIFILPLLIMFAALLSGPGGRIGKYLAGVFLGAAVAVKFWPVFFIGAFIRRGSRWAMLGAFVATFVVVSVIGANAISHDWIWVGRQFLNALDSNSAAITSDWNLAFNYTWGAGLSYATIMVGGPELLQNLRPAWLWFQGPLIFAAPAVAALVFLLKRPFWVQFALSSSLFLTLTSFSPPYRVVVLLIAAGLMVRYFRENDAVPGRLELWIATFLGLAVAPTYLWTLPGITPLGVAPSGTLVGSFILLTLTVLLIIHVARRDSRCKQTTELTDAS